MNLINYVFMVAELPVLKIDFDKVILYLTPVITLIGWAFTFFLQRSILGQNRKYQKSDRDLSNFRERLSIINGIISSNIVITQEYTKLSFMFRSGKFDFEEGGKILLELSPHTLKLASLMYDPGFRSLQNLLPQESSKKIYDSISDTYSKITNFHMKSIKIDEFTPNLQTELDFLNGVIIDIIPNLMHLNDLLSRFYAELDIQLAK